MSVKNFLNKGCFHLLGTWNCFTMCGLPGMWKTGSLNSLWYFTQAYHYPLMIHHYHSSPYYLPPENWTFDTAVGRYYMQCSSPKCLDLSYSSAPDPSSQLVYLHPRRQQMMDLSPWHPCETLLSSQFLASAWPSPICSKHLKSKPANGRSLLLLLLLNLSLSLFPFQISKK